MDMLAKIMPKPYLWLLPWIVCNSLLHVLVVNAEPILPLSLPANADAQEIQLGKQLFHSTELSGNGTISCASCHNVSAGGDDGMPKSVGIDQQLGKVNAPTVINSRFNFVQFWDGRAKTLEEQVEGPIHNPLEMATNWPDIVDKLNQDQALRAKFHTVYGEGISQATIVAAIVAYERQLVSLDAPFDRYLEGDQRAISPTAAEGYQLFKNLGCVSCHQGQNVGGNMYQRFGIMGNYFEDRGNTTEFDYGVYNVSGREEDRYKFKVPSLRNIQHTAPYLHDGSIATIDEAVRIMARYQLGRPISDLQVSKIKAFLLTLSGEIKDDLQ